MARPGMGLPTSRMRQSEAFVGPPDLALGLGLVRGLIWARLTILETMISAVERGRLLVHHPGLAAPWGTAPRQALCRAHPQPL